MARGEQLSHITSRGGLVVLAQSREQGQGRDSPAVLGMPVGTEPLWQVSWQLLVLAVISSSVQN